MPTHCKRPVTLFVITLILALSVILNWDVNGTMSGSPAPTETPWYGYELTPVAAGK